MNQLSMPLPERRFDGDTYEADKDCARLTGQLERVYGLMQSGDWFTLSQLARFANCSEASASARIRDLRKPKWGAHKIERERIPFTGLFMYRMAV
jgi:hypothetical protein